MSSSRSVGLPVSILCGAACGVVVACTADPSLISSIPLQGTDSIENEDVSLFDTPDTAKRRKEAALEKKLAHSLSSFTGVERALVHLTLADTSVLLKTPQKQSHAAVLIVRDSDAAVRTENMRRFIMAAVPSLADSDLEISFTNTKVPREKIVDLAYLRVTESSVVPLKITLSVLLGLSIVSAIALIVAGIFIRRLKHAKT